MKKFLGSFAAIVSAFAANANAMTVKSPNIAIKDANTAAMAGPIFSENVVVETSDGSQFDFILKRDEHTGLMMAAHGSHSSHSSHSSHKSHYSGR
ncbi:His-Xaa-Ser repeat protein HxsA2 [Sphingomonas sp. NCPPB 2930]